VAERYAAQIDRDTSPHGCHLWLGALTNGYGKINVDGRMYRAHRVAWELAHGPIPDGYFICHNCPGGDNRRCVNPAHLYLGTPTDNARDTVLKGRNAGFKKGAAHVSKVLTVDKVLRMRQIYASGLLSYDEIARAFRFNRQTVRMAIKGETWRELA